jgi:oxygen-independent coproporphyrinogen III oxidase
MNLGVYIQVPFCRTKCTYCNFHTGVFLTDIYSPYVNALVREITEHDALYNAAGVASEACRCAAARPVDTFYIGGGTPSLLDPRELLRIMDALRGSFACQLREVTLEADPETVTREKVAAWHEAGINRVSLGTQSFNDKELSSAGRLHRSDDTFAATAALREGGIANFSFDLIAGLPHQTEASWRDSLRKLIALAPNHVSVYMLEIDEGSRLGREALAGSARYSAGAIPADDAIAEFYELARHSLAEAGYEHYEISNWAKPGGRSLHNLKYWQREPYFGIGAGAHSFDAPLRWANAHDPGAYITALNAGRLPVEQRDELTATQSLDEELFVGLRLLEGVDVASLEARYDVALWNELRERIDRLAAEGFVECGGGRLRLAPERIAVSNEVFVELMQ